MNFFDILYVLFLFGVGASISLVFVSNMFIRMTMGDDELAVGDYVPYEGKYIFELEEEEECNPPNIKNVICEYTPSDGIIMMRYNKEEEGFEYWTDKHTVDFKILKTVCRKYCLTFNCKNLYIDPLKEAKRQSDNYIEEKKKKEEEEEKEEEPKKEDSVFVKPKMDVRKEEKKFKIDWKDNKFIKKGKLNESPITVKRPKEKTKEFSFRDFKNMMKKDQ